MITNKLTALQVKNLIPKDKLYRVSDGGGLYLNVRPSGSKKFEFRYNRPNTGKPTFLTLGDYPELSLANAREKAMECRRLIASGVDPQHKRATDKAEQNNTFFCVAEKWKETKYGSLKEKTLHDNWRKLELYVFPQLKNIPISSLTAPVAIEALKPVEREGKHETVRRACQLVNEIMNYAVNYGYIPANPLLGIKDVFKKPIRTHLHALPPHELPELMQSINSAQMYLVTRCLMEFQLHTMVRPNEAAGARWDEIDFENNLWIIPEERMKMNREHRVPLTKHTLAILDVVKERSKGTPYVFLSPNFKNRSVDSETINRALTRMGFKGRTTAHGFRSLASTTLNEQGFDADVIEAALAHVDRNKIRSAYNRTTYLDRRRKLMEWWSNHIEQASYGNMSVTGTRHLKAI